MIKKLKIYTLKTMQMALIEMEPVSPTLIVSSTISRMGTYLLQVIFEYTHHSLTRLNTENALGKHALTSVLQDMLVWP